MRLTEKLNKRYAAARRNMSVDYSAITDLAYGGNVINKLGRLEDIEDKINFSLEKAFECLEKGVYKFDWTRNIEHCDIPGIEINGLSAISKLCSSAECDELLRYEEYGSLCADTEYCTETLSEKELTQKSCVLPDEIFEYLDEDFDKIGFALHIKSVIPYEKPQENKRVIQNFAWVEE